MKQENQTGFIFSVLGEDAEATASLDEATSSAGSYGQEFLGSPAISDFPGQRVGGTLGPNEGQSAHAHATGTAGTGGPHVHTGGSGGS